MDPRARKRRHEVKGVRGWELDKKEPADSRSCLRKGEASWQGIHHYGFLSLLLFPLVQSNTNLLTFRAPCKLHLFAQAEIGGFGNQKICIVTSSIDFSLE